MVCSSRTGREDAVLQEAYGTAQQGLLGTESYFRPEEPAVNLLISVGAVLQTPEARPLWDAVASNLEDG